jgi:hypothetical protein
MNDYADIVGIAFRDLRIDKNLVLNFLTVFSRFEYTLKRMGYLRANDGGILVDWDRFASTYQTSYEALDKKIIEEQLTYLLNEPPKKQRIIEGSLRWTDQARPSRENNLIDILNLVRRVRNNLFHGGKFSDSLSPDPERNTKLLNASLSVLAFCLSIDKIIYETFGRSE